MHISLSELLVIFLVALVVIKPERLPDVATRLATFLKTFRILFLKLKKEFHASMMNGDSFKND